MVLAGRGGLVWLGMVLAGLALAAYVALSWPEPSFRLVRLPYGESMPKTPAPVVVSSTRKAIVATTPDAAAEPDRAVAGPVAAAPSVAP